MKPTNATLKSYLGHVFGRLVVKSRAGRSSIKRHGGAAAIERTCDGAPYLQWIEELRLKAEDTNRRKPETGE